MYRIAVCDDDPIHRRYIIESVRAYFDEGQYTLSEYGRGEELLNANRRPLPFDIVLMDVQLDGENGIEVCKKLCDENLDCQIIFVSGYRSYVLEAYDVTHVWYVYKPEARVKLPLALERAKNNIDRSAGERISIKSRGAVINILLRDILYFEQKGRRTSIVTRHGVYTEYRKAGEYADMLDGSAFVQCHKSFVVNMNEAVTVKRTSIEMADGRGIPVSRTYAGNVDEWFAARSRINGEASLTAREPAAAK